MKTQNAVITTILAIIFIFACQISFAQFDIQGKVQRKTDQKINEKIDQGVDNTIDGIFNKKDRDKKDDDEVVQEDKTEDDGMVGSGDEEVGTEEIEEVVKPDEKPKMESYSKYDFIPGDQILFYEDFSQDAIGDFPALWTTDGTGEIRTINNFPGKWLYMNGDGSAYCLMKDLVLPQNYIIEFDIVAHNEKNDNDALSFTFNLYSSDKDWLIDASWPGTAGFYVNPTYYRTTAKAHATDQDFVELSSEVKVLEEGQLTHYILWVQNRRLRIYVAGQKIIDGPTALPAGATYNRLRFHMWGEQGQHFLSNIKITTAAPDMRSKLLTEGKLVSYGIYFDSGKDEVKPESYGSLKEIAAVLTENPAVNIQIVGHTDSDGDDAMNLDLSKRRAANVKNSLVKDFGISADRIQTDGKGESIPLNPNTSVENKAKNRRVEFIKL